MPLDNGKNFSKAITTFLHSAADVSITLGSGQGANLPDPAVRNYNLTWHDFTNFPDPSDDPNVEIITVTAKVGDVLTGIRGQENIVATTKNTSGATYRFLLTPTDKFRTDVEEQIQNRTMGFVITTGTGSAYVAAFTPAVPSLVDGAHYLIQFHLANDIASPTIDLDGTGAKIIRDQAGNQIPVGFMQATSRHVISYRSVGDIFVLLAIPMATGDLLNNIYDHGVEDGASTGSAYKVNYDRSPGTDFDNLEGAIIRWKATNASVAGATLQIETGSANPILKNGGLAIEANDIQVDDSVEVQKNVNNGLWYLMSAGVGPRGGIQANFISAFDTTTQTVSVANTFQDITVSNNGQINGWTHTAATANFVCPTTDKYLVTYRAHLAKTTGSNSIVELIALFNGVEVAGSQGGGTATVNNVPISASGFFILNGVATQILKFQLTGGTVNSVMLPIGGNAATQPSMQISITRI